MVVSKEIKKFFLNKLVKIGSGEQDEKRKMRYNTQDDHVYCTNQNT